MTAHVVFEALDPARPATLSPAVMRLLREQVGFDGCAISDDLEMKAVAEHFPLEEAAPGAVAAGVDALLVCHTAGGAAPRHRPRPRRGRGRAHPARAARRGAPRGWPRCSATPGRRRIPRRARALLRTEAHLALAARIPALATGGDPTAA